MKNKYGDIWRKSARFPKGDRQGKKTIFRERERERKGGGERVRCIRERGGKRERETNRQLINRGL